MPRVVCTYDVPNDTVIATLSLIGFIYTFASTRCRFGSASRWRDFVTRRFVRWNVSRGGIPRSPIRHISLSLSLSVFRPLFSPPSLSLSLCFSLFTPSPSPLLQPPLVEGWLYIPTKHPVYLMGDYSALVSLYHENAPSCLDFQWRLSRNARTKTLSFPDTRWHLVFFADLDFRLSLACLAYPHAGIFLRAHGYPVSLSHLPSRVSNALVSGVSGITTDRCYDDWLSASLGVAGGIVRGGRAGSAGLREGGIARWVASSRFMALAAIETTLPSAGSTILGAGGGDAANIAFSVAFLFYVPLWFFLFWPIVAALPSTTDQPGYLATTRQQYGELAGWITCDECDCALLEGILSLLDISVPIETSLYVWFHVCDHWTIDGNFLNFCTHAKTHRLSNSQMKSTRYKSL